MERLDGRLFTAVVDRDVDAARRFLDAGANVNARDADGSTPLHRVCSMATIALARLLLSHGADVNARDNISLTPLDLACMRGRTGMVRLLLENGAEVNARDGNGWTALHWAIRLSRKNPARKKIVDLFREHHPELVMEAWCRRA